MTKRNLVNELIVALVTVYLDLSPTLSMKDHPGKFSGRVYL